VKAKVHLKATDTDSRTDLFLQVIGMLKKKKGKRGKKHNDPNNEEL